MSRSGDRHGLTATVANRGSAVAAMVRLSWPSDACSSRRPVLTAEAYNSAPTTLRG
ncbi:hypothetical protein [Streptomyces sp. 1222.5]|uniref:hypothetical protein n=1 Tax=Streptomyces sp. 1222.5 TaxID=1881026 RepID=UPI003D755025